MPNAHTRVEESWEGAAPSGANRDAYVTYTEADAYLYDAIRQIIGKKIGKHWFSLPGHPVITLHECWSGYSEYTITSTWSEIGIEWGEHSLYYESMGAFFTAAAEADAWFVD